MAAITPTPWYTLFRAAEAPLWAGDYAGAASRLEAGREMRYRLAEGQITPGGVTDILATSLEARIEDGRGNLARAGAAYERAVEMADAGLREGHRYRLRVAREQATFWIDTGRPGPAIPVLQQTLEAELQALGPENEITGRILQVLGRAHVAMGDWSAAATALDESLEAFRELPRSHWRVGEVTTLLGVVADARSGTSSAAPGGPTGGQVGTRAGATSAGPARGADPRVQDGLSIVRTHLGESHPRYRRLLDLLDAAGARRPVAEDH